MPFAFEGCKNESECRLIQEIVSEFEGLPNGHILRGEFAVLILLTQDELADLCSDRPCHIVYQPRDNVGNPAINYDYESTFSPADRRMFNNFLVAIPTGPGAEHAEEQILRRMSELLDSFRRTHGDAYPAEVLLYTWNYPCRACTDGIFGSFRRLPASVCRDVVYSSGDNKAETDYCWLRLHEAGTGFCRIQAQRTDRIGPWRRHDEL